MNMTRTPISPISIPVDTVALTPNPENPIIPEFPRLPEREPEFPNPFRPDRLISPCNLRLKAGCYRIALYQRGTGLVRGQAGTLRVEVANDARSYAISGDLYKGVRKLDLNTGSGGLLENWGLHGWNRRKIPIFSRERYHSYLKVVKVSKPPFVPNGQKCKITLVVEEYAYTPPPSPTTHGEFSETPTRTLHIVLEPVTLGMVGLGPKFKGRVFEGGVELDLEFSMEWVSRFFRRATLEVESIAGVTAPMSAGSNNFQTIYATAGWDLTVRQGDTSLALPADVSATDPWSNAELHAFMLANRTPNVNLDTEWHYYYLAVPHDSGERSGIFGIMFDRLGDEREGSCNFIDNMSGNFGDDASRLRSAAHEVGHGFNQLHPEADNLEDENFIMTQSGDTRTAILAAGGSYPDDIRFEFSPHHRHHLVHAPDIMVRPGGEDFGFGHFAGGVNPEDSETAATLGLGLELATVRNHIKMGELLMLDITLKNGGNEAVPIPSNLNWSGQHTRITVSRSGEAGREVSSFVHSCDSAGHVLLEPGRSVSSRANVFWDTSRFVFTEPGVHRLEVTVAWQIDGRAVGLKTDKHVWVDYPVSDEDNRVAALLMHPEVGKYIALNGNAVHLKTAVTRFKEALTLAKDHPACQCICHLDETGKKVGRRRGHKGTQSKGRRRS